MVKKITIALFGITIGLVISYLLVLNTSFFSQTIKEQIPSLKNLIMPQKQVIGFLPFWLLPKAQIDYSPYLTTLTYFGLTIDTDGTILKLNNPQEQEPGWNVLNSGKVDPFFIMAGQKKLKLSLLVFAGSEDSIASLMNDPVPHADNLVAAVAPIMKQYKFTELNLDIESSKVASESARESFTQFTKQVKKKMDENRLGTLSVDISPTAFIKNYLINPNDIAPIVDSLVIMGYDYHYSGSFVSGPVAPLLGGGTISEFDVSTGIDKALAVYPPQKIILGLPLYGYEWETLKDATRSATIPGTGLIASDKRVEILTSNCASCSATFDQTDQEPHIIYLDNQTGTYHQIFYTNSQAMQSKINYAKDKKLGGLALWALGYEDSTILNPLKNYK